MKTHKKQINSKKCIHVKLSKKMYTISFTILYMLKYIGINIVSNILKLNIYYIAYAVIRGIEIEKLCSWIWITSSFLNCFGKNPFE